MKNQKGQFIVEAILLMVIFFGILSLVATWFKSQGVLGQLVQAPWQSMAGMIQNSEWKSVDDGNKQHPSQHNRHITILGEVP